MGALHTWGAQVYYMVSERTGTNQVADLFGDEDESKPATRGRYALTVRMSDAEKFALWAAAKAGDRSWSRQIMRYIRAGLRSDGFLGDGD